MRMCKKCRPWLFLLLPLMLLFLVQCDWFDDDDNGRAPAKPFVLTTDTVGNTLTLFSMSKDNGTLTLADTVTLADVTGPMSAVLHPNRNFLFVVNSATYDGDSWNDNGSIAAYRYNDQTGALTEVAGSPFYYYLPGGETLAIETPINIAITPNGKFLYVSDQGGYYIHIFRVNGSTGALTATAGSPVDADDAHGIAMDPSGRFLYDGDEGGVIRSWVINQDNGDLVAAPNSPYDASGSNVWIAPSPNGKWVYTAGVGYVTAFSVNRTTGELTLIEEHSTSQGEKGAEVSPDNRFLFTANFDTNSVGAYTINEDTGALTAVEGSPFAAGTRPKTVSLDASGKFLYVANFGSNNVSAFAVDQAVGSLTLVDTYAAGTGPKFLLTLP